MKVFSDFTDIRIDMKVFLMKVFTEFTDIRYDMKVFSASLV